MTWKHTNEKQKDNHAEVNNTVVCEGCGKSSGEHFPSGDGNWNKCPGGVPVPLRAKYRILDSIHSDKVN